METEGDTDNRYSADLITGPTTNLDKLHKTSPMPEQGHGSTINSHLKTHPSELSNNQASHSSPSSSVNPFLPPSDATTDTGSGGMMNDANSSTYPAISLGEAHHSSTVDVLGPNLSFAPSAHGSSQGNPFEGPTNADNEDPVGAFDSKQNQSSAYETVSSNVESHNAFPVIEQGHQSMVSGNLETPFPSASESSSQEPIQVSVNATNKSHTDTYQPSAYETVSANVESHNAFFPVIEQGHQSIASSNLETPFSSAFESSSQDPVQVSVNASSKSHTNAHQSSTYETVPTNAELHNAFPVIEQGHQSIASSDLETPFSSANESSRQEHIQVSINATGKSQIDTHQPSAYEAIPTNVQSHNAFPVIEQGHQSIASSNLETQFSPASESSNQEPIQVSVNASSNAQTDTHQPSAYEPIPANVESHNAFPVIEQGHQSMASSNLETPISAASKSSSQEPIHVSANATNKSHTDTHATPILEVDSQTAAKSSDDDVPISSVPKHGQSGDVVGQYSAAVAPGSDGEFGTNQRPEIQNPPFQVMERPGDSDTSVTYVFPPHVFARNNTNAPVEWSTASNESLFSIYMGNTSFSSELTCFGKSTTELDKPSDISKPDPPNAKASHQPPTQVNKFNDISQRTAELHGEGRKVTEAKAAETMREVIMETIRTTENDGKGNHGSSKSHDHPDGSTTSYAFRSSTGKDRSVSGGDEEKQAPQQSKKQEETPNRWLSCFACCTFCH